MTLKAVSSICALENGAELWVADTGLHTSRAHRAWADSDLDDVCSREYKFLNHLSRHHITSLQQPERLHLPWLKKIDIKSFSQKKKLNKKMTSLL